MTNLPPRRAVLASVAGVGSAWLGGCIGSADTQATLANCMVLNHDSSGHRLRVLVERDGERVADREFDLGADEFSELDRAWSSEPARFEVTVEDVESGETVSGTAPDDPAEQEAMVGYRNTGELNVAFGSCCIGNTETPTAGQTSFR